MSEWLDSQKKSISNIRKANENDSRDIFEWRNDELTRQISHTTDLVEWDGNAQKI